MTRSHPPHANAFSATARGDFAFFAMQLLFAHLQRWFSRISSLCSPAIAQNATAEGNSLESFVQLRKTQLEHIIPQGCDDESPALSKRDMPTFYDDSPGMYSFFARTDRHKPSLVCQTAHSIAGITISAIHTFPHIGQFDRTA